MRCPHEPSERKNYVPPLGLSGSTTQDRRRLCIGCGLVQVQGDDHGRKIGYFVGLLDRIQKYLERRHHLGIKPFVEVERRLIIAELARNELFNDRFGSMKSMQREHFIHLLSEKRKGLTVEIIEEAIFSA